MKTSLVEFQFCYRLLFGLVFVLSVTKIVRTKSEPQIGASVVTKAQTIKANDSLTPLHDLNAHLSLENSVITEDFIQQFSSKTPQSIFFKRLHDITLRSQYRVTSFIDFSPYKISFLH